MSPGTINCECKSADKSTGSSGEHPINNWCFTEFSLTKALFTLPNQSWFTAPICRLPVLYKRHQTTMGVRADPRLSSVWIEVNSLHRLCKRPKVELNVGGKGCEIFVTFSLWDQILRSVSPGRLHVYWRKNNSVYNGLKRRLNSVSQCPRTTPLLFNSTHRLNTHSRLTSIISSNQYANQPQSTNTLSS